jgi:peptide/nickel transport system permease protein
MSFQPVLLWSDLLLWFLVFAAGGLGVYSRSSLPLLRAWRQLGKSAVATGSATLLFAFLLVGLLDSLHYRPRLPDAPGQGETLYGVEVFSVLDALLAHLRTGHEKTYSAPFAIRSHAMETVESAEGITRVYPRLVHGGAHLAEEAAHGKDIAKRVARGIVQGLLLWVAIFLPLAFLFSRRRGISLGAAARFLWRPRRLLPPPRFAWNGVWGMLLALCLLFVPLFALSGVYHVFGTDKVGQDVFYLVLKSIRTALVIGLVTTLVTLPIAIVMGIAAGYFQGWVDDLIQYIYTVLNSIPGVLLIAASVLMMQVLIDTHPDWFSTAAQRADARLLALCLILGMTSWTSLARLLRGETLKLRELEYIQAAQAFGVPAHRILGRHILANLSHIVVIAFVMDFSALVLTESVLSYIGIGVDPAMISFGTMINNARMELGREPVVWWTLAASFLFMFTLVLAANLFADAIRDAFDPSASGRQSSPGSDGAEPGEKQAPPGTDEESCGQQFSPETDTEQPPPTETIPASPKGERERGNFSSDKATSQLPAFRILRRLPSSPPLGGGECPGRGERGRPSSGAKRRKSFFARLFCWNGEKSYRRFAPYGRTPSPAPSGHPLPPRGRGDQYRETPRRQKGIPRNQQETPRNPRETPLPAYRILKRLPSSPPLGGGECPGRGERGRPPSGAKRRKSFFARLFCRSGEKSYRRFAPYERTPSPAPSGHPLPPRGRGDQRGGTPPTDGAFPRPAGRSPRPAGRLPQPAWSVA